MVLNRSYIIINIMLYIGIKMLASSRQFRMPCGHFQNLGLEKLFKKLALEEARIVYRAQMYQDKIFKFLAPPT